MAKGEYVALLHRYDISPTTAGTLADLYVQFFILKIIPPNPRKVGWRKLMEIRPILRLDNYERLLGICKELDVRELHRKIKTMEI